MKLFMSVCAAVVAIATIALAGGHAPDWTCFDIDDTAVQPVVTSTLCFDRNRATIDGQLVAGVGIDHTGAEFVYGLDCERGALAYRRSDNQPGMAIFGKGSVAAQLCSKYIPAENRR